MNEVIQNAYKMADTINKLGSQFEKLEESIDKVQRGTLMVKVEDYSYRLDQLDIQEQPIKDKIIEYLERQKEDALDGVQTLTIASDREAIKDEVRKELLEELKKQFMDSNAELRAVKDEKLIYSPSKHGLAVQKMMCDACVARFEKEIKKAEEPNEITEHAKEVVKKVVAKEGYRSVDDLDLEEVKAYYLQEGMTQKRAAKHFNVGQNAFGRYLQQHGLSKPPVAQKKKMDPVEEKKVELDDKKVVDLICNKRKTLTEAAEILGTDKKTLHEYCRVHQISFPSRND